MQCPWTEDYFKCGGKEFFENDFTYRRQIIIELPVLEAFNILEHRLIHFENEICNVALNLIISGNNIGPDHGFEQDFIDHIYGEAQEEMLQYKNDDCKTFSNVEPEA